MKRNLLALLFLGMAFGVFAQKFPVVGIAPFEAGQGTGADDAANAARLVLAELGSWGTLTVIGDAQAETAEFIVQGKIEKQDGMIVLTAATIEAKSGKTLNESREQAAGLNAVKMVSFCTQLVQHVPLPNYLLGKWQSLVNLPDGKLVCVMEFRSDRSVRVEQFDTWERRQHNVLKYEGYGTGTYSYVGYAKRTMTVKDERGSSRQSPVDAIVGFNINLEESLPEYASLNQSGLGVLFNESKTTFELLNAGLPCGRNYDGSTAYPFVPAVFTQFTKIR